MRIAYLHGFAGDPSAWADVITDLPGRAIALPGHRGSAVRDSWASNLDAVAAAIGEADVVVGYSLGARVALGLVARGDFARAVLVSVNPGIADSERTLRRSSDASLARLLRSQGIAAFVDAWEAQPLFASQVRVPAELRAARRARRLALDPEQLARSLETMGLAEMPDYRGHITRDRFALIAGADDAKYVAIARGLAAPFELIADSGHDPTLEQPTALASVLARSVRG